MSTLDKTGSFALSPPTSIPTFSGYDHPIFLGRHFRGVTAFFHLGTFGALWFMQDPIVWLLSFLAKTIPIIGALKSTGHIPSEREGGQQRMNWANKKVTREADALAAGNDTGIGKL